MSDRGRLDRCGDPIEVKQPVSALVHNEYDETNLHPKAANAVRCCSDGDGRIAPGTPTDPPALCA